MKTMIILEGPDNGGKSTLATKLGIALGLVVQGSEGPSRYPGEINERCRKYLAMTGTLFDRFPAISNPIYDRALSRPPDPVAEDIRTELYGRRPLLIYCEPLDRGLNGHVVKERESAEHINGVQRNARYLSDLYQAWALRHATMIYRIGDDVDLLIARIRAMMGYGDFYGDIGAFHRKFGLEYEGGPRDLDRDLLVFRADFLAEEFLEYVFPNGGVVAQELRDDIKQALRDDMRETYDQAALAKRFDALIDLTYVALGTAYLHGFDFNEGWRRVQTANMMKVRAERADQSTRGSTFDVVKPTGWRPPVLDDLVSAQHTMRA